MDNLDIITQAAKEIAILDAEIKELTERRDMLKSHFKDGHTYPPGKYPLGDVEVVISTNSRISQKKAEAALTAREVRDISVMKVDAKRARALLNPQQLEAIMDTYDNRVEVRVAP